MQTSIPLDDLASSAQSRSPYTKMAESPATPRSKRFGMSRDRSWTVSLIGSYIFDWLVLVAVAAGGGVLSFIEPNKRPFSLYDRNISFPFTENETVPVWLLLVVDLLIPIIAIFLVCLLLVPGKTAPKGTPKSLIWKRKFWELHVGWLGLALSVVGAWFITNGMKNMFGRPRPDLISRCQPDYDNFRNYIVGGVAQTNNPTALNEVLSLGMLVSADICQQTDSHKLDDGFRSYPSGHSSSASAGLLYLSLFLASKFSVTFPFAASTADASSNAAFPSRIQSAARGSDSFRNARNLADHHKAVTAVRRQAAAPPIYLLCIVVIPFFASVFIAGSRWFDFRRHAFDIIFGYLIGVLTSIFGFYFYHMPIRDGAGWAWGPRSHDKAWWSGVGTYSYASDDAEYLRAGDEEEALTSANSRNERASSSNVEAKLEERRRNGNGIAHHNDFDNGNVPIDQDVSQGDNFYHAQSTSPMPHRTVPTHALDQDTAEGYNSYQPRDWQQPEPRYDSTSGRM